jgi:hypothetical protein
VPAVLSGSVIFLGMLGLLGRFPPEVAELLATRRAARAVRP